jgi:hypothetical protein
MKIRLAFALLTFAAPSTFARQDPTVLRDQLREIARPEETAPTPNTRSNGSAPATDTKRRPTNSEVAERSVNAHKPRPSILSIGGSYRGEIEVAIPRHIVSNSLPLRNLHHLSSSWEDCEKPVEATEIRGAIWRCRCACVWAEATCPEDLNDGYTPTCLPRPRPSLSAAIVHVPPFAALAAR